VLRVADDYELIVRTALHTKTKHINKLLYKQYINPNSAQRVYNAEIQGRVAEISQEYADRIREKYS
jgi:hypothetical protein